MAAASITPRPPLPDGPFLVVGLARSGAAAAIALLERGAHVYGTDSGTPADATRLAELGVELSLDGDGTELLNHVGAVVKSPGVPRSAPVIETALRRGTPVIGELELGWRMLANRFVAVTGTNGKTTVAEWLGHVWRAAGQPVEVAGNVGTPLTALPGRVDPAATIVCECSSFQLEDSLAFAPEVAVLLNLSPDHLDRHATVEAYREAKLRIFANQGRDGSAVIDADEGATAGELPGAAEPVRYGTDACTDSGSECDVWADDGWICDRRGRLLGVGELGLAGEHNLRNAMAVAASALASGLDRAAVAAGLRSFAPVPHRLERLAEIDGVIYVNDSKATNVAAAAAALRSFAGVHAILGGSLKGSGFAGLAEPVAERCRACYLVGEAAGELRAELAGTGVPLIDSGDLASAAAAAAAAAEPGDTVLLAPACASFDAFRDFEERGERFRELVGALR